MMVEKCSAVATKVLHYLHKREALLLPGMTLILFISLFDQ